MPASEDDYRQEYEDFTGTQDEFDSFYDIFQSTGYYPTDEQGYRMDDEDQELGAFFEFLNTFYPDTEHHDKEWWDDLRSSFFEMYGLTGNDIDWQQWREVIERITPGT